MKSKRKKNIAGTIIRITDVTNITLLCIRYFLKCHLFVQISSQVKKPMPPTIIKIIITMFIVGSPTYPVRDGYLFSVVPSMSNPALQKAETE